MPAGRPRQFDRDEALDAALKVFWRKGFEGASLPDLTAAMGINRPSLYAAFGNKEALFRQAIERYLEGPAAIMAEALQQPTARQVAETAWLKGIELTTGSRTPRGCFLVQGALACGEEGEGLKREAIQRRKKWEALLRERFQQAIAAGDLPKDADAADLARYVTTVSNGIAVQAASGAARDDLRRTVEIALRAWPT